MLLSRHRFGRTEAASKYYNLRKKPFNNRIRAREVRLVDETGKQIGVITLEKALQTARERGLDLVQVTEKVVPPVCRITDYGKYLYKEEKKQRTSKQKKLGALKGIRLRFNISSHDLETRVKQTEKFLNQGNKVKVEMQLRGREKAFALQDFAKEKINTFLELLGQRIPFKTERELKKEARGFTMIISKQ